MPVITEFTSQQIINAKFTVPASDVQAGTTGVLALNVTAIAVPNELITLRDGVYAAETNVTNLEASTTTSASNAATSATEADVSNIAAGVSEAAALSSEDAADTSAVNAKASEDAADTSASAASTSEINASNSESAAALSESNATNSASAASISEGNAATSETNAATAASDAVSNHVALPDPHTQYTKTTDLATVATSGSYGDLSGIADNLELKRYNETVATGSATLDRADGGIQTFTMTANITLAVTIAAGESLTFHLSAGDTYAVTWPTMTWVGGSTPTLTAADVIEFWKVGSTLYGAYVGAV